MTSTMARDAFSAQSWPVRVLRASAAASTSVLLAVGGHSLGGGEIPTGTVFALLIVLTAGAFVLAGRRVTTGQIVGLLLIGQVLVHTACMIGAEPMSSGPTMVLGHLLATAVATLVLRRGEEFLWSLAERLGLKRMGLLLAAVGGPTERTTTPIAHDICLLRLDTLVGGVGLRGPPVGCN